MNVEAKRPNHLIAYTLFTVLLLLGCTDNKECLTYSKEIYADNKVDSTRLSQVLKYKDILLERFNETSIRGLNDEAYHLMFYSAHGFGKSVKFEKNSGAYSLSVKCVLKRDWYPCKAYSIKISEQEWNVLRQMTIDFNFWTEKQIDTPKNVLDGHTYFLEGVRPDAERCGKKIYNIAARSSPDYNKIGALCEYILQYEEELASNYTIADSAR